MSGPAWWSLEGPTRKAHLCPAQWGTHGVQKASRELLKPSPASCLGQQQAAGSSTLSQGHEKDKLRNEMPTEALRSSNQEGYTHASSLKLSRENPESSRRHTPPRIQGGLKESAYVSAPHQKPWGQGGGELSTENFIPSKTTLEK